MPATAAKQKTAPVESGLKPELNGKMLQQLGTSAIYLVDHGWRRYLNDATIESTFKPDPSVEEFPVDEILLGSNVALHACLIKAEGNPAIYLVDHNPAAGDWTLFKRHIVSPYVYELYQFGSNVFIVPEIVIHAIPTGDPIVGPPILTAAKR
jgi:hypothetical protein